MWAVLHENMTDSKIVQEKFPNGVQGTPLGTPTKGLYCIGFWRGLPQDVIGNSTPNPKPQRWTRNLIPYPTPYTLHPTP